MTTSQDLIAAFAQRLSLKTVPASIEHAPAANATAWAEALAASTSAPAHALTKTLLLKSKSAKKTEHGVQTVMVVALDASAVPLSALAKELKEKEVRFANEDVVKGVFGGAVAKEAGMFKCVKCSHVLRAVPS